MFTSLIWSALVNAAPTDGIPQSTCYPQSAEAQQWPVKVVYLHGLFTARGGDTHGFRVLEQNNRVTLKRLADQLHVRIALPVSPRVGPGGMREWNGLPFSTIESLAKQACHVDQLSPGRAMIGFSNGGYAARRVGTLPCTQNSAYAEILAIGAPDGTVPGRCGNQLVNRAPHIFPGVADLNRNLAKLGQEPAKPAQMAAADDDMPDISQ